MISQMKTTCARLQLEITVNENSCETSEVRTARNATFFRLPFLPPAKPDDSKEH